MRWPVAEYKGHARESIVKDILKADMDGMFARCVADPGLHARLNSCMKRSRFITAAADTRGCCHRRFPKGDHEMFDLNFITKVSFIIWASPLHADLPACIGLGTSLPLQEHEVEHAYGTVLAAICFCSFIYPIASASLPADRS